ncbi:MAG: 16S rRNA (uracil(1498)-N(3))-methyltransferase [Spirochaetota bacterium]
MNLIILNKDEIYDGKAEITGRRLKHILTFVKPSIGDSLKTGLLNGLMGEGVVTDINDQKLALTLTIQNPPPAPLPLKLILAMPRPKVLNRVIQHATAMGIKEIYIIKTWRVEKSYWESPMIGEENILRQMIIGLEQGKDTILPAIQIRKRFKPFVEDELPSIVKDTLALVSHPAAENPCPRGADSPVTLAIGPEGGFIPYEVNALQAIGFKPVSLGDRILRVETALPFLIGRLF